jgi:hypothetical protein
MSIPHKHRVQKWLTESLDSLFATMQFKKAVRNVLKSRQTKVSQYTGFLTGLERGDEIVIATENIQYASGIYVLGTYTSSTKEDVKILEYSVAITDLGTASDNTLAKAGIGGTPDAQFNYSVTGDTIKVKSVNLTSSNPAKIYDLSYKVMVFYKS